MTRTSGHTYGAHLLFSSSKAYRQLTGHRIIHNSFQWLWKTSCQNKHKVFFWLLLKDRLSTRELLKRRNMELPNYSCVCCTHQIEESTTHLFIHCDFSQDCQTKLGLMVNQVDPFTTLDHFRIQLNVPFFLEIIIVMSWCIWMQRNDFIFRGIQPSQVSCWQHFKKELALVILNSNVPMARSTCVIFFIFFVSFFVS